MKCAARFCEALGYDLPERHRPKPKPKHPAPAPAGPVEPAPVGPVEPPPAVEPNQLPQPTRGRRQMEGVRKGVEM